ncbi:MAG TPA: heparinase II/III family protein [Chthoniobacteraceae bacterium]|nr:heparinase II/III family protein [Chthoniobacteraceae bacterium]
MKKPNMIFSNLSLRTGRRVFLGWALCLVVAFAQGVGAATMIEEAFSTPHDGRPDDWEFISSRASATAIISQVATDDWRLEMRRVTQTARNHIFYTGTEGSIVDGVIADFEASATIRYPNRLQDPAGLFRGTVSNNGYLTGYYAYTSSSILYISKDDGTGTSDGVELGHISLLEDLTANTDYLYKFSISGNELTASVWRRDEENAFTVSLGELTVTDTAPDYYQSGYFGLRNRPGADDRGIYFSDVTLTVIPEPGQMALVVVGLGCLVLFGRSRAQKKTAAVLLTAAAIAVSGLTARADAGETEKEAPASKNNPDAPTSATAKEKPALLRNLEGWENRTPEEIRARARLLLERREKRKDKKSHRAGLIETAGEGLELSKLEEGEQREAWRGVAHGILDVLLEDMEEHPERLITTEGGRDPINFRLREATLEYALRYAATGSRQDADTARALLLRYAEVTADWPLGKRPSGFDDGRGKAIQWVSQEDRSVYQKGNSTGVWGRWNPLELRAAYPLLQAYELILPRLSAEDRDTIDKGVFAPLVEIIERWPQNYSNTVIYQIQGLIRFGLVLKEPLYIHKAVTLARDLLYIGFYPDGFWREVSPSYHRQVAMRLIEALPRQLEGYSDPEGYTSPDGERLEDLQFGRRYAMHLERMQTALDKLTLPDGFIAAVNDSDPDKYSGPRRTSTRPELLGTSGFAILGSGEGKEQEQLILNFANTSAHSHLDVNAFHWFGFGNRLFDETRYRPLPGSGSSRSWSWSTAAHNTVVVDQRNQHNAQEGHRSFGPDDAIRGKRDWPKRGVDSGTNHGGDLMLFGESGQVQVVEVEGKKAYAPLTSLYRRTLAKVALGGGNAYLVDIFRVKGGGVHDYMLHGPLAHPYGVAFSFPLRAGDEEAGPFVSEEGRKPEMNARGGERYIKIREVGEPAGPWTLDFSGKKIAKSRTTFVSPAHPRVLSGEAPAINRMGTAPFIAVRNEGGDSLFVAVHEIFRDRPQVRSVRLLSPAGAAESGVAVGIELGDRMDVVLSGLDARAEVSAGAPALKMRGRLGYMRLVRGEPKEAVLWDGTLLAAGEATLVQSASPAMEGRVVKTLRKEEGAEADALVVDAPAPGEGVAAGSAVHVDLGGELVWSYRTQEIAPQREATSIAIEHEPGFTVTPEGLTQQLFHPGWGMRQPATFRIPFCFQWSASDATGSGK